MKNKKGFTLAEVLITLGIIGVVAAITLPTMMQDGKKQQLGVKLAKFTNNIESILRPIAAESGEGISGDDLTAILNEELILNSGTITAGTKATLRDGTEIQLNTGHSTYSTGINTKYGPVSCDLSIEFFPNINGLDGQTSFKFVVTDKGFVVPESGDDCLNRLYQEKWRATKYYNSTNCPKPTS